MTLTQLDEIIESLRLKFLTMKREVTSIKNSGNDFSFAYDSRLVLSASEEGDWMLATTLFLRLKAQTGLLSMQNRIGG